MEKNRTPVLNREIFLQTHRLGDLSWEISKILKKVGKFQSFC